MAVATTTAIAIGLAAAGTGYSVYAGERANDLAQKARNRTREAQAEALRTQMVERARSVQADLASANRPSPASTIKLEEMLATTDRTGGVDDRLKLSRPSKLGGS